MHKYHSHIFLKDKCRERKKIFSSRELCLQSIAMIPNWGTKWRVSRLSGLHGRGVHYICTDTPPPGFGSFHREMCAPSFSRELLPCALLRGSGLYLLAVLGQKEVL